MFNQPLKCDTKEDTQSGCESDYDDDNSTAGESTGTGRISGATSDFEGEDTVASAKTNADESTTRTCSQPGSVSPWPEFTASKQLQSVSHNGYSGRKLCEEMTENMTQSQLGHLPEFDTQAIEAMAREYQSEHEVEDQDEEHGHELQTPTSPQSHHNDNEVEFQHNKAQYVPIPPLDYASQPLRPFRDPSETAQNRLPFMTPIIEKTESSLAPNTYYQEKEGYFVAKTPSRSTASTTGRKQQEQSPGSLKVEKLLLSSPFKESPSPGKRKLKAEKKAHYESETSSPPKLKSNLFVPDIPDVSPWKKRQLSSAAEREETVPNHSNAVSPFHTQSQVSIDNVDNAAAATTKPVSLPLSPSSDLNPIIPDQQCNPINAAIRTQILASAHPPLSSYPGFFDRSTQTAGHYSTLVRFAAKVANSGKLKNSPRKSVSSDKTATQAVPPTLTFKDAERVYAVKRELGHGAYAPVYLVESAEREKTPSSVEEKEQHGEGEVGDVNESDLSKPLHVSSRDCIRKERQPLEAIKTEQPPTPWEFYILRLLQDRLGHASKTMESIIQAHECHLFRDECYLVLKYYAQGTLLNLVNVVKAENVKAGKPVDGQGLEEPLAMFFAVELLRILETVHSVGILHGDVKADNCLVRFEKGEIIAPYGYAVENGGGTGWESKGLTLIDFGRGIDTRAFRKDVGFIADWPTCPQDCAEIRECRPWTYQIDYFGAAGVIHSLLFGKYIDTVSTGGGLGKAKEWRLKENFKRYWQGEIWSEVFAVLLNPGAVGDGEKMPTQRNVRRVRERMEAWLVVEGERKGLRGAIRRCEALVGHGKR